MNWGDFEREVPDFARAGVWLMTQPDGVAIAFLATIHRRLHVAPVCPIFCGAGVYLSVGRSTPKRGDLDHDGRYVLHAFLGANDEEFRVAGRARRIEGSSERGRVLSAIRFAAFDRSDPIYLLDIESAMWGYWENAGHPEARPIRKHWRQVAPNSG